MSQLSFSEAEYVGKRKKTRREKFLAKMERAVPWKLFADLVDPHYPKPGIGRPPYPLETMLRIYFMQLWFSLSDPAMEETLYDSFSMRQFAKLPGGRVPDETTILNFRHLLEQHNIADQALEAVNLLLQDQGIQVRKGTIVDATIIDAPSSTKNASGTRDPEMHQTKKGNQWRVSRTQAADLWCCTEDGSRPPEAGLQEQASNHPVLLRSKGAVVSDWGKVIP